MLVVETIARIRRAHLVQGKSIKAICRELHVSRKVVRKVLRSEATEFRYEREQQPMPRLGAWRDELDKLLAANEARAGRERLTLIRIFEALRGSGYEGGYDAVRRYARTWRRDQVSASAAAYVPLSFAPGEAYQFDWSYEIVLIGGTTVTVKVAHLRLCHSRMLFVRAYPRETQEMVFDAHDRAFAFFKGACTRGIYDNLKAAVDAIFVGRERAYNRRFLQMCSHYLVDPVACTPASGWEKGQVENQVGLVRERFFSPRLRGQKLRRAECLAAGPVRHVRPGQSPPGAARPDGMVGVRGRAAQSGAVCRALRRLPRRHGPRCPRPASYGSTTSDTRCRRTRSGARSRSAPTPSGSSCARAARSLASTAVISVATRRCSIPGTMSRCWPASPAPCATARRSRDWLLPSAMERIRRKLAGSADGDRQMVTILAAVLSDGLAAVEAACAEALREATHSADVVINILARHREPAPPITILTPDALRLTHAPIADCARYDSLRRPI